MLVACLSFTNFCAASLWLFILNRGQIIPPPAQPFRQQEGLANRFLGARAPSTSHNTVTVESLLPSSSHGNGRTSNSINIEEVGAADAVVGGKGIGERQKKNVNKIRLNLPKDRSARKEEDGVRTEMRNEAEVLEDEWKRIGLPAEFFLSSRKCSKDCPVEYRGILSNEQHQAYYHIQNKLPCTILLSRACADFEQFLEEERYYRQRAVKEAMQHAWGNYEKYAFGKDELLPLSGMGKNGWGGYALTMVDSLDTLLIMNMEEEYERAKKWILRNLNFDGKQHPQGLDETTNVNFFEMTIRLLGGFLGAYALRPKDKALLQKASDLGKLLSKAFCTQKNLLPYSDVDLVTGAVQNKGGYNSLAEVYVPLEWKYLAEETNHCQYSTDVDKIRQKIIDAQLNKTIVSMILVWPSGNAVANSNNAYSFGARGDSFYELDFKKYLFDKHPDPANRKIYDRVVSVLDDFAVPVGEGKMAIIELKPLMSVPKMDHLVCFLPGVLALDELNRKGKPETEKTRKSYKLAEQITAGCYEMYNRTATGIAPEITRIGHSEFEDDLGSMHNLLRPETVESLFLMSMTANKRNETAQRIKYENWGWDMFQAFQSQTRVRYGYAGLKNVQDRIPADLDYEERIEFHNDLMPSFFIAETLKYFYLLFEKEQIRSELMDKFLLSTEAHFIPRSSGKCDSAKQKFKDNRRRERNDENEIEEEPTQHGEQIVQIVGKRRLLRRPSTSTHTGGDDDDESNKENEPIPPDDTNAQNAFV